MAMEHSSGAQALALFDFDGTLIPGDSIVAFVGYARKKRALSFGGYCAVLGQTARYLMGGMTDAEIKTRSLRFWVTLTPQQQEELAQGFVRDCLLPQVYLDGKNELQRQKQAGRLVVLVSASTDNYMRCVADALGVDALLCTPIEADGAVRQNCKGEEKPRRVQDWLKEQGIEADWAGSYAFGDSKSDAPMLRLCGHPVLVNPKKALRQALPEGDIVSWH